MAADDDAVETLIYQQQQLTKKLSKLFHEKLTVAELGHERCGGNRSSAQPEARGWMARVGG